MIGGAAELSDTTRLGLQWALALARHNAQQQGTDIAFAEIDSFDLFAGLLLAEPDEDAEAAQLLKHFDLTLGNLLPTHYLPPTREVLEQYLENQPAIEELEYASETHDIFFQAQEEASKSASALENIMLLKAMFTVATPSALVNSLTEVLEAKNITLGLIDTVHHEYLENEERFKNRGIYTELLERNIPFDPAPIHLPNYKADHGNVSGLSQDLVDIKAEVDAFAYLLASKALKPPMAVGLFGDWGSGKSFFMESVRQRIARLTQSNYIQRNSQKNIPFWKKIVQIRFNAWHYVEGELWASLVDHIFNQLSISETEPQSEVEKRQAYWQRRITDVEDKIRKLEEQKKAEESKIHTLEQAIAQLQQDADQQIHELEEAKQKTIEDILLKESLGEVQDTLNSLLGWDAEKEVSADKVLQQINEAQKELNRGHNLWRQVGGARGWVYAAVFATPLVASLVAVIPKAHGASAFFAGLSTLMVAVFNVVQKYTIWLKQGMDRISTARQKVQDEIDSTRADWQKEIKARERSYQQACAHLQTTLNSRAALEHEVDNLNHELASVTPVKLLNEFIKERVGSDDYRELLGLPALIQRDFEKLSKLIREHNEKYIEWDTGEQANNQADTATSANTKTNSEEMKRGFNRIILYIDDLDRCTEERVIKVLQAVHLLLAFDLFVVVVAVDARWLNHALVKHYPALALNGAGSMQNLHSFSSSNGSRKASSDDYLEKIFQIPFWVDPLQKSGKQRIVEGLLRPHLKITNTSTAEQGSNVGPVFSNEHTPILQSMNPGNALPALETTDFSISKEELDFLLDLADLLGHTPRSVKRFVNLYQLVRIIYRTRQPENKQPEQNKINDEFIIAFLLGISDGLPDIIPVVMKAIENLPSTDLTTTLNTILNGLSPDDCPKSREKLENWIRAREQGSTSQGDLGKKWSELPVYRMKNLLPIIERFLFRVGTSNNKIPLPIELQVAGEKVITSTMVTNTTNI